MVLRFMIKIILKYLFPIFNLFCRGGHLRYLIEERKKCV